MHVPLWKGGLLNGTGLNVPRNTTSYVGRVQGVIGFPVVRRAVIVPSCLFNCISLSLSVVELGYMNAGGDIDVYGWKDVSF